MHLHGVWSVSLCIYATSVDGCGFASLLAGWDDIDMLRLFLLYLNPNMQQTQKLARDQNFRWNTNMSSRPSTELWRVKKVWSISSPMLVCETLFWHRKHTHSLTSSLVWWIPGQYKRQTCRFTHPSCFFPFQWRIRKAESMQIHVCMSQSCSGPSLCKLIRVWIFTLYACYQKDLYSYFSKWDYDIVDQTDCSPNES